MFRNVSKVIGIFVALAALYLISATLHSALAASSTYCFNSYSSFTWDSAPTNITGCTTTSGTTDNNNGHYAHFDASEYTSGGTGTITKVETRVYYKNNWTSGQSTRDNVAQLQPYFGGSNAGTTHNDATGNHSTAAWSATFDITNDTNAPSTWTWSDVAALDMRLIDYRPNSGQITVYRIEMIVTYNEAPTLSISQPDGTGDTVTVGDSYNITYTLADNDNVVTAAFYYDSNNTGLDGTAISGACASAAEGSGSTCSWNTTGITPGTYYVYGITTDGTNSQVSAYSSGQITINVVPAISVSITSDGTVSYGTLGSSASKSTIQLGDTQTAKNDGNVAEDFNIKTSAPSGWTLGASPGTDIFVHEFSTNSGSVWTPFSVADTYQSLVSNIAANSSQSFDLRFTAPNPSTSALQKTITITIQAVQH